MEKEETKESEGSSEHPIEILEWFVFENSSKMLEILGE